METIYRDAAEFKSILSKIGYRRKKVALVVTSAVTINGLNWSGGSRTSYAAFELNGTALGNADAYHAPAPWNNPGEGVTIPIPTGTCVVSYGTFMGKPAMARIHVCPEDMPALLT